MAKKKEKKVVKEFVQKPRYVQIIYAIIVGLAVVAFWRGAWELMDLYIFPGNHELSLWTTLIAGIIIAMLIALAATFFVVRISKKG